VQRSGTIVASTVSLGYDLPRTRIEELLLHAAERAGLKDPFVRILAIGDFSVTYRVAGLLEEVKQYFSATSLLNAEVLDALHADNIEIVSPSFMNTRPLSEEQRFIPKIPRVDELKADQPSQTEDVVFDKAETAEAIEAIDEKLKSGDD
jgi:small-conductance mechanosensitive channel